MERFETAPENPYLALADELDTLQARENDGRGVSSVRAIVRELRAGNLEGAKAVAYLTDADKIRNYPVIEEIIKQKLVA